MGGMVGVEGWLFWLIGRFTINYLYEINSDRCSRSDYTEDLSTKTYVINKHFWLILAIYLLCNPWQKANFMVLLYLWFFAIIASKMAVFLAIDAIVVGRHGANPALGGAHDYSSIVVQCLFGPWKARGADHDLDRWNGSHDPSPRCLHDPQGSRDTSSTWNACRLHPRPWHYVLRDQKRVGRWWADRNLDFASAPTPLVPVCWPRLDAGTLLYHSSEVGTGVERTLTPFLARRQGNSGTQ